MLQLVVIATVMFVATVMALFANKNFSHPGIMLFGAVIFFSLHSHVHLLHCSPAVCCTPYN